MAVTMPTEDDPVTVVEGDALTVLRSIPAATFDAVVTSPPYWGGLRDYGCPGQLGLERNPADYVAALLCVFAQAWHVLKDDGTLWLNVGDVFAASGKGGGGSAGSRGSWDTVRDRKGFRMPPEGYKMKDLTLTPFLLADSVRRDGWYLRQTVVWEKPNAAEPARLDRPSVSHEYVFLFAKNESYAARDPGESWWQHSVWKIAPDVNSDHPATMPRELARRCIVAATKPGGLVLDPFGGSGTTGHAALAAGRRAVLVELNPEYAAYARRRVAEAMGRGPNSLFAGVA